MDIEVKAGDIYRHFKGNRYEIVAVAQDCDDGSLQVVYKALYPPYTIYVRPYFQFIEELDSKQYPTAEQRHRFEKEYYASAQGVGERKFFGNLPEKNMPASDEAAPVKEESYLNRVPGDVTEPIGLEGKIDYNLLRFLSARTYEEQIEILREMKGKITDEMFSVMFVSLDFPMVQGSKDERYNALMKRLETMSEFDGKRFRD
ncbi:MAG: DUF1653 domain-containing protein [Lachnospiraceae bacterium]|nr:DUF1653 domain-containing protein [Lachnospiraceae bacterium]